MEAPPGDREDDPGTKPAIVAGSMQPHSEAPEADPASSPRGGLDSESDPAVALAERTPSNEEMLGAVLGATRDANATGPISSARATGEGNTAAIAGDSGRGAPDGDGGPAGRVGADAGEQRLPLAPPTPDEPAAATAAAQAAAAQALGNANAMRAAAAKAAISVPLWQNLPLEDGKPTEEFNIQAFFMAISPTVPTPSYRLAQLWEWFDQPYGLEVPLVLKNIYYSTQPTVSPDADMPAFFVPHLSAIQIFAAPEPEPGAEDDAGSDAGSCSNCPPGGHDGQPGGQGLGAAGLDTEALAAGGGDAAGGSTLKSWASTVGKPGAGLGGAAAGAAGDAAERDGTAGRGAQGAPVSAAGKGGAGSSETRRSVWGRSLPVGGAPASGGGAGSASGAGAGAGGAPSAMSYAKALKKAADAAPAPAASGNGGSAEARRLELQGWCATQGEGEWPQDAGAAGGRGAWADSGGKSGWEAAGANGWGESGGAWWGRGDVGNADGGWPGRSDSDWVGGARPLPDGGWGAPPPPKAPPADGSPPPEAEAEAGALAAEAVRAAELVAPPVEEPAEGAAGAAAAGAGGGPLGIIEALGARAAAYVDELLAASLARPAEPAPPAAAQPPPAAAPPDAGAADAEGAGRAGPTAEAGEPEGAGGGDLGAIAAPDRGGVVLEFYEARPPGERPPLYDTVLELAEGVEIAGVRHCCPALLEARAADVDTARSWFAVAWYPILCHAQTASAIRGSFITYHRFRTVPVWDAALDRLYPLRALGGAGDGAAPAPLDAVPAEPRVFLDLIGYVHYKVFHPTAALRAFPRRIPLTHSPPPPPPPPPSGAEQDVVCAARHAPLAPAAAHAREALPGGCAGLAPRRARARRRRRGGQGRARERPRRGAAPRLRAHPRHLPGQSLLREARLTPGAVSAGRTSCTDVLRILKRGLRRVLFRPPCPLLT